MADLQTQFLKFHNATKLGTYKCKHANGVIT